MSYCLPKFAADDFKGKLKSGEINPEKLSNMTSEERRNFFTGFLGKDHAIQTNALFESKLLLKNQQQGIITWAKTVGGLKPEARRELIDRVGKMTEVLQPKDAQKFYEDLAAQKLGARVTPEEAQKIADLAKNVEATKGAKDRMEFGRARVAFNNYVSDLKNAANKPTLGERLKNPVGVLSEIGGTTKSLKASLDNSAIFRQGWKTMFTNPVIWQKNARQSFVDIAHSLGGKKVLDETHADIMSRPTYDAMKKAKLDVGTTEEAYPTHLPAKVPILGRAYTASEEAYTAFVQRTRADVFDKYLKIAETAGIDISDKEQLLGIGKVVNALTGRGDLGAFEGAAKGINNIFFAPRNLKSNIDLLTVHAFDKGITPFARKQAAMNLVKVITGTASILAIANAIKPGSVDWDPRSANFGKIRIGDTRFDVTGGIGSIPILVSRLITMSSKSSVTGKITKLNSGKYGAQTGSDVLVNFAEGKLSPIASVVKDILKGKDFNGNKPTVLGEANNLLTPLPVTNAIELNNNPHSANVLAGIIADALGISVNTYSKQTKK